MESVENTKSQNYTSTCLTSSHVINSVIAKNVPSTTTSTSKSSAAATAAKKDFISIKDASILTGIQPQTLRKMGDEGKIQMYRTVSGQRKFHRASLESMCYNRGGGVGGSTPAVIESSSENGGDVGDNTFDDQKQNFVYCRVSVRGLAAGLEEQKNAIYECDEKYKSYKFIKDISSGTNFRRKGLLQIIEACVNKNVGEVVIVRKNRLATVGLELLEQIVAIAGGKIVCVNENNRMSNEEMLGDIVSLLQNMKLGSASDEGEVNSDSDDN